MGILNIDGILLRKMIIAGANELNKNRKLIDDLNVFPVPDGDTGTNMSLTVLVAAKEVEKLNTPNVYDVAKAAANGSLRGARGNSGVILSQLFRGFAKGLEGNAIMMTDDLANAFVGASEMAYRAVMKPKEGTILTVARAFAEKAAEIAYDTDDIEEMMVEVFAYADEVLNNTTQMLPELKLAGVVDAGGKGIITFLEGAFHSIHVDANEVKLNETSKKNDNWGNTNFVASTVDIKFGYCTEFFINVEKVTLDAENSLKEYLASIGDSIVVVGDEVIIKVHVHTNQPGNVLEHALKMGTLSNMKIENMREQHSNLINFVKENDEKSDSLYHESESIETIPAKPEEQKEIGFVAISLGRGFTDIFKDLGVDVVIEGGQTMNPSTEDVLLAVEKINAKHIIILPNNKNIILAANQAVELSIDKQIHVLPTKTIPQGLAAIIGCLPSDGWEENFAAMQEAVTEVKTGQITYAVRDTFLEDQEVMEGDILCMLEGNITLVSKDIQQGTKELLELMLQDGGGFVSIYYGEDVSEEQAKEIKDYVEDNYSDMEVELHAGGQPVYYYILSVE